MSLAKVRLCKPESIAFRRIVLRFSSQGIEPARSRSFVVTEEPAVRVAILAKALRHPSSQFGRPSDIQ
jgi:hypothetical protein